MASFRCRIWEQNGNKTHGCDHVFRSLAPTRAIESSASWRKRVEVEPTSELGRAYQLLRTHFATSVSPPPTTQIVRANVRSTSLPESNWLWLSGYLSD